MSETRKAVEVRLSDLLRDQARVGEKFNFFETQAVAAITNLLKKAGVYDPVHKLEVSRQDNLQKTREVMASLSSQIAEAQELLRSFDGVDMEEPPEPRIVCGINIDVLDFETRLMVLDGNVDTITALGGTPPQP